LHKNGIIYTEKASRIKGLRGFMLRDFGQITMPLSPYQGIYDLVVSKDHLLRQIKENIDFSFVNPMLKKQYCEAFGRPAKEPEMMFKLMFLKKLYDLSDVRLISQAQTDMAYKYFLDLDPEAEMVDPSLMTKFRKTRITEDILEEMLKETIRQAIEKGIIKSKTIIVDSTHTNANVRAKTVTQVLRELSRGLRKEIYKSMYDLSEKFPDKPDETADLEEEIEYTQKLLESIREGVESSDNKLLKSLYNRIKELLDTNRIREIRSKDDEDARFGHKKVSSTFFGFKNHLAMTEERIVTGIEVTNGGEPDGKQLAALLEKSQSNGVEVKEIVGDMAYVSEGNLDVCEENGVTLIAKTNSAVAAAAANANAPAKDLPFATMLLATPCKLAVNAVSIAIILQVCCPICSIFEITAVAWLWRFSANAVFIAVIFQTFSLSCVKLEITTSAWPCRYTLKLPRIALTLFAASAIGCINWVESAGAPGCSLNASTALSPSHLPPIYPPRPPKIPPTIVPIPGSIAVPANAPSFAPARPPPKPPAALTVAVTLS
jgi:transposase